MASTSFDDNWLLFIVLTISFFYCCGSVQFRGDLVTASPDVFQVTLGKDAEFLLLASDGLWDYMSRSVTSFVDPWFSFIYLFILSQWVSWTIFLCYSSEAVDFVRNQLRQHGDVQVSLCFVATSSDFKFDLS